MTSTQLALPIRQAVERLSNDFSAQKRSLAESEDRVCQSEAAISRLQRDCRALEAKRERKEKEIESAVSQLAQLRKKAEHIASRNNRLTEQERHEAEQRESTREEYIAVLRDRTLAAHAKWKKLQDWMDWPTPPSGRRLVDELHQLIGELEAAFVEIASARSVDDVLSVGSSQQVFDVVIRAHKELYERLPSVESDASDAGAMDGARGVTERPTQ